MAQLAKALFLESGDSGFESHQNLNLLQIFLQNHNKMVGITNIIITGVTVSETMNKKIEYGVALEQDPLWKSILRFSGSALSQRSGWESLGGLYMTLEAG